MNFQKNRPLTPPLHFRKMILQIFYNGFKVFKNWRQIEGQILWNACTWFPEKGTGRGGQWLFWIFPKIHRFWYPDPSLLCMYIIYEIWSYIWTGGEEEDDDKKKPLDDFMIWRQEETQVKWYDIWCDNLRLKSCKERRTSRWSATKSKHLISEVSQNSITKIIKPAPFQLEEKVLVKKVKR